MDADESMGTVVREDDRVGVRFERWLAHPPQKVWRALTESEQLRHWLPCDLVGERRAGASLELPFWPAHIERYGIEGPPLTGEIRVWEPPEVFEWTWDTDVLRWELRPTDAGTHLVFTTWLGDTDPTSVANAAAGYHVCLQQLQELVDTGTVAQSLIDRPVGPWEHRYAVAAAAALGVPDA
jgi:uncharacterized protein YndB with AHSA1/START domain